MYPGRLHSLLAGMPDHDTYRGSSQESDPELPHLSWKGHAEVLILKMMGPYFTFRMMESYFALFFLRFYLFIHVRHRKRERRRHRQRQKQASCREPDVGLDPRTPGSRPGPKAGAQLLSHPGVPILHILF